MKRTYKRNVVAFRFRRFTRAAYAAFNSLHREVSIGRVAAHITEKQLLKSKRAAATVVCCSLLLLPAAAESLSTDLPDDSLLLQQQLEELSVEGQSTQVSTASLHVINVVSAQQIQNLPAQSLNELLDYLPGIDVRTRGAGGAQADLSLRGGTFDQVLVLLNGINITDAQTGHANLDVPIDMHEIERIEILEGTSVCQYGLSAFSGAVNIITYQAPAQQVHARVEGGDFGYFTPAVSLQATHGRWQFHGAVDYHQSTGYKPNTDYKYGNVYFHTQCHDSVSGHWSAQAGVQIKQFGSQDFYSFAYPDQFEATRTLIVSAQWDKRWKCLEAGSYLYYRRHYDRFELFREGVVTPPDWYKNHNYHVTDVGGMHAYIRVPYRIGNSTVGVELRDEHIFSTVLGDSLAQPVPVPFENNQVYFTHGKNRLQLDYFLEQNFIFRQWKTSVGLSGNYNTMFGSNFAATINAGYQFVSHGLLSLNLSRALRMPTYTDLYYQSPTQLANPNLQPEQSYTVELDARWQGKGWRTSLSVYYRMGLNIIDWVKLPDETQWRSTNHTRVDAWGGECMVGYHYGYWLKNIALGYAYCSMDKQAEGWVSKYALDYLRHKVCLQVSHGIYKGFGASWQFTFQQRAGHYIDSRGDMQTYQPVYLLDGRIFWQGKYLLAYVEASNILGLLYYDYGGIEQPGRWVKAGISVRWDWKRE